MPKVLLIGNDINNATNTYSWDSLIDDVIDYANLNKRITKENKPFPMLYEEIYLNAARQNKTRELNIKKRIAENTQNLQPNEIHDRICNLNVENILTTNYDLTFERSIDQSDKNIINKGIIRESFYSLFRYHQFGDKNIWHVHGSETTPNSITLGYEHYSGYLQQMRNYAAHGIKGVYKNYDFPPMAKRMKDKKFEQYSWVDFFFTHDIYIFGLNLDFVEMHLWWLLTFRTRANLEGKIKTKNKIIYYYPEVFKASSQYKLDLLEVNGVKTVPITLKRKNLITYYNEVIDHLVKN